MWSVGCIFGELLIGKSIFPGVSTLNQIERVLELMEMPTQEDIKSMQSEVASNILDTINLGKKRSFEQFFPGVGTQAMDLLKKLLVFNPQNRITAQEALEHPYVAEFRNPEEEISCSKAVEIPINDHEKYSIKKYREALYNEINERKKE